MTLLKLITNNSNQNELDDNLDHKYINNEIAILIHFQIIMLILTLTNNFISLIYLNIYIIYLFLFHYLELFLYY